MHWNHDNVLARIWQKQELRTPGVHSGAGNAMNPDECRYLTPSSPTQRGICTKARRTDKPDYSSRT